MSLRSRSAVLYTVCVGPICISIQEWPRAWTGPARWSRWPGGFQELTVRETLGLVLKYEEDLHRVQGELASLLLMIAR